MDTLINAESFVFHIESDLRTGQLLFVDVNSLRITDGQSATNLVGLATEWGYKEDVGTEARFNVIRGFAQINETTVIISDTRNDCLRLVNRESLYTSTFTGTCTLDGNNDGVEALFHGPGSLLLDPSASGLIVTENGNNAVRYVNLMTREVSTLINKGLDYPAGIAYDKTRENLLITDNHSILKYNLLTNSLTLLSGSNTAGCLDGDLSAARFDHPKEILALDNSNILVADDGNNRIRVIDTESNSVTSICTGAIATVEGYNDTCHLRNPYSLILLDGALYVGQYKAIRRLAGRFAR